MMKIRCFEVLMAIEMCKILVLKGELPGMLQSWVAAVCKLGGSSVFCRRLPNACLLIPIRIGPDP